MASDDIVAGLHQQAQADYEQARAQAIRAVRTWRDGAYRLLAELRIDYLVLNGTLMRAEARDHGDIHGTRAYATPRPPRTFAATCPLPGKEFLYMLPEPPSA